MRFHHFGYVVGCIDEAIPGFQRSLQASWNGRIFDDPHQKVRVAFLTIRTQDAQIELVQPLGADSPVARFLQERGGGLHHCCYEVDDLENCIITMRGNGALLAKRPKPAVAFDGRRIAWLITTEGLLIELVEATAAGQP
jgi:methylmalonyl-CoA/ethylmalonyl-CoA epimerase